MDFESERRERIAEFLKKLETIAWFSQIGQTLVANQGIARILDWSGWPGPEEFSIEAVALEQQAIFDEIMNQAGDEKEPLKILWDCIHSIVLRVASSQVPYDPEEDAWHAPSSAVWMAAWTAGNVGLLLALGKPLPDELKEQWNWYERGHWPCGRIDDGRLLIY
jgi:hypothetical protein